MFDRQKVYFRLPAFLQNILLSGYGLKLRRQRYGGVHRAVLAQLLESEHWPAERLAALQLEHLGRVVEHAARTVPLYRERLRGVRLTSLDQLADLPMVTKTDLRAPREHITSEHYRGVPLAEIHTGGTTGTPLTVFCDDATLQRNYAFFARLRSWARIPDGARVATFAGRTIVPPQRTRPPFWRSNLAANTVLYSSYHLSPETIPLYLEHLGRWQPLLIDSYPSSLEPIARHILARGGSAVRPAAIITSSETLQPEVRDLITAAFHAPVFDHYAGAEMATFVSQCDRGTYHVNPEFGILEVLRDDGRPAAPGETGEVIATGFINPVMPLIRYQTGDLAIAGTAGCACGRAFPTIARVLGRMDDVIVTPEGRRVGRLDPVFKAVSSFHEARIVQDGRDHVRVEYVAEGSLDETERVTFLKELGNRLGPSMRIDLVRVPQIPRTRRGKLRLVVNEMAS